jgi:hypothetical protein
MNLSRNFSDTSLIEVYNGPEKLDRKTEKKSPIIAR